MPRGCVTRIRRGDRRDDPAVRGRVLGVHDTAARVRAVDHPVPPRVEQGRHESNTVRRDRTVGSGRPVTLPGRGVQHHLAFVRGVREGTAVVVGLRSPDLDGPLVEVVVPEHLVEAGQRRVPGDEGVVVGLDLVGDHVHLVALTVVDENVPATPVTHHLEVPRVLVDVQHDPDVLLLEHPLEVGDLPHIGDGHGCLVDQGKGPAAAPAENEHRPGLGELGQRFVPLAHLVEVDIAVGEVDRDFEVLVRPEITYRKASIEDSLSLA